MAELLLGCGNRRIKKLTLDDNWGWSELVTIDHDPNCGADIVHDLEVLPWPLETDQFDEVHSYEVLEHLGDQGDYKAFFAQFSEIYRILKPGGVIYATVPAWDDVWAWADPSHRRIIAHGTLVFLDRTEYAEQIGKTAMTDFRWLWHGDFEPLACDTVEGCFKFALRAHKPVRC